MKIYLYNKLCKVDVYLWMDCVWNSISICIRGFRYVDWCFILVYLKVGLIKIKNLIYNKMVIRLVI